MEIAEVARYINSHADQAVSFLFGDSAKRDGNGYRIGNTDGDTGRSMFVNAVEGLWVDHATGEGGDILDLWQRVTRKSPKEAAEDVARTFHLTEPAEPKPAPPIKANEIHPAAHCTMAASYMRDRGVKRDILSIYRVASNGSAVIFPRFSWDNPTGNRPAGLKFWTATKDIRQSPGSQNICFGWQGVKGQTTLVITEGEIDCLSVAQEHPNVDVVSVPSGATNLKWIEEDRAAMERYRDIVLWMDADEAGQSKVDAMVHAIGRDRVRVVSPEAVRSMGCKDANDLIRKGLGENIVQLVDSAAYRSRMVAACSGMSLEELSNSATLGKTPMEIIRGIKMFPQEMTVLAGYNGTGKTTLALQMAQVAASSGVKPFIMSPEMPPKKLGSILARQSTRIDSPSQSHWGEVYEYVRDNFMVSVVEERLTTDDVISDFDEAYAQGCRFFLLDSLTCVRLNELNEQADFADRLRNWVRTHANCYLLVLAHMRKPPSGHNVRVNRYDIRGAGEITDLASAVYLMARKDPFNPKDEEVYGDFDAMVLKDKCRETGKLGRTWLMFNDICKLFHDGTGVPAYMPVSLKAVAQ